MRSRCALAACLLGLAAIAPASPLAAQSVRVSLSPVFGRFLARHFAAQREAAPDATYQVAWHDLNGDGRLEALV